MYCRGCDNQGAVRVSTYFNEGVPVDTCDQCSSRPAFPIYDCFVPEGGMFFEHLSHPDFPESHGGTFCADKATKAYYLKKYKLQESGDRVHGSNNFDPIAARYACESLRK